MSEQKITKTVSADGSTATVSVSGALTIENCGEFHSVLADALNGTQRVALDMRRLEGIDITALQIICSTCKTASKQDCTFVCEAGIPASMASFGINIGASRGAPCNQNKNEACIWFGGGK